MSITGILILTPTSSPTPTPTPHPHPQDIILQSNPEIQVTRMTESGILGLLPGSVHAFSQRYI